MITRIFRKIVLSLGALHLTLMAAIGIWFWSSPARFELQQPGYSPTDKSFDCALTSLLGKSISLSSSPLQAVSLMIYIVFVVPGLNLLMPATLFLALHISYHRVTKQNDNAKLSVMPVYIGLMFLLAVNVVFMVNIESTISLHRLTDESTWTFGQTLAVLLLVLPLRDVFGFIMHVRNERRRARYTKKLTDALEANSEPCYKDLSHFCGFTGCKREFMHKVKRAVKYADIRVEASGMSPVLWIVYEA
jgi:hypothetical protein